MPMKEANQSVKQAVSDILGKFVIEVRDHNVDPIYDPILELIGNRGYTCIGSRGLRPLLCGSQDVDLGGLSLCVVLEAIEDPRIFPLLILRSSQRWVHFRIYTMLWTADHCSELQSLAIRFETDEGDPETDKARGAHDFCHAQLCASIAQNLDATTPSWTPESQPSYPLDAEDQVSLVLCMLVSMYGGRRVAKRLSDLGMQQRLEKVRALKKRA